MTTRNKNGTFKQGVSGNKKGKPKDTGVAGQIRKAIADKAPEIVDVLIGQALEGDNQAAIALLNRISPTLKAVNEAVEFKLDTGQGLSGTGSQIVQAIASGEVSLDSGAQLLSSLSNLAKLQELDEITKRLDALESAK